MRILKILICWLVLSGLWILFAFKADAANVVSAAAVSAVITAAIFSGIKATGSRFTVPDRMVGHLSHLPVKFVTDTGLVMGALWKRIVSREEMDGKLIEVPFEPGGDDPASATRRAVVIAAVSLTPNSLVIELDERRKTMLVHQLAPAPDDMQGRDRNWPV